MGRGDKNIINAGQCEIKGWNDQLSEIGEFWKIVMCHSEVEWI